MISSFHIKRKRNCRDSYFRKVVREYPLRMQRTGGKNCDEVNEKDWYKKGWTMDIQNMSWVENTKIEVDFLIDQLKLQGNEKILESKTRYLIQFNDCPLRGVA